MLVLSRRIGEELVIGGNVTVKIVSVQGLKVRIAISAPADVSVDRAEVHHRRGQFDGTPTEQAKVGNASCTCSAL